MTTLVLVGCSTTRPAHFSYPEKIQNSQKAFEDERWSDAKRWAAEALEMRPNDVNAQKLMGKVLDAEIAQEKILQHSEPVEELIPKDQALHAKTWVERAQSLLEMNQVDEAYEAAEKALQIEPDNLKASRVLDRIKARVQKAGTTEDRFVQELYEEEVKNRVEHYTREAESFIAEKRWGAARFTLEKTLILDPGNSKVNRLLDLVEAQETRKPTL